jgi:hypothetical protein
MFTFTLAEYLPPFPNATWTLARQAGVTLAVSQVPADDLDAPTPCCADQVPVASGCRVKKSASASARARGFSTCNRCVA